MITLVAVWLGVNLTWLAREVWLGVRDRVAS